MGESTTLYAPRYKVWPPAGYVPPTAEEFEELRRVAARHSAGGFFQSQWDRMDDETLTRRLQLVEIRPRLDGRDERGMTDYARELRREMNRRGLVHRSIAILRCESCPHATERLWEATQQTHPGMENRSGTPVESAWLCAQCWSGGRINEPEDDEPAED